MSSLETTQHIHPSQYPIRQLKDIHTATHPAKAERKRGSQMQVTEPRSTETLLTKLSRRRGRDPTILLEKLPYSVFMEASTSRAALLVTCATQRQRPQAQAPSSFVNKAGECHHCRKRACNSGAFIR